ncbi:hypothetical protein A1O7_04623 [Cladophialophora yegresii CBS 114405]|uniref:Uncharacterized protein n=1 Tax=Cladophialophora yegresii CBS 114405 TaxID=1182544 RepID=W9W649_9EURO|nr:uncharacterized protein A1O7_04623 [Cladophialophora yegresii CBS 114405]EXJ60470.1 hypothetical protein A1O7_04623 [Cladophialophora yegresii CBS 114405]
MGADEAVIITSQPTGDHDLQEQKPTLSDRILNGTRVWASRFFPWSAENGEVHLQDVAKARYVPWLGLSAMMLSGMTILFSWIVLQVVDGHLQKEESYLKPASWLSAILSANSVFLHIALTEGVTMAWWFMASRKSATVRDIHDTWTMGQSLSAVLLAGKRFNYVALATLFVASIPLNGFLLQNAITIVPSFRNTTHIPINVGIVNEWPAGFSAYLSDGSFSRYNDVFGDAMQLIDGDTGTYWDDTYLNKAKDPDSGLCGVLDASGTCTGRVVAPGFWPNCTTSYVPYNMDPKDYPNQTLTRRIFSTSIDWDVETPNVFTFSSVLKYLPDCDGQYLVRNCTFQAARISYPFALFPTDRLGDHSILKKTKNESVDGLNVISLNVDTTYDNDTFVSYLDSARDIDSGSSTFGGVAHYLQSVFNAEMEWTWNGSIWSINATGRQAETAVLNTATGMDDPNIGDYGPTSLSDPNFCYNTLYYSYIQDNNHTVIEDEMRDRLRNLMFMASVLQYEYEWLQTPIDVWPPYQTVLGQRTAPVLRYKVLYRWWAGSLAVTTVIILMITPTFWGFWRLRGKVTLNPVDTAAALDAPLVHTDKDVVDPRSRLKEIGARPLYSAGRSGSGSTSLATFY